MKTFEDVTTRDLLLTLLRVALGIVFIAASAGKISDPVGFSVSLSAYKILSGTPALLAATVLPWMELLCGAGLVLGVWARGCSLLTSVMLVAFTAFVISALVRGLDISCGCFTQDPAAEKVGWRKIGENVLLFVISLLTYRFHSTRFSLGPRFGLE